MLAQVAALPHLAGPSSRSLEESFVMLAGASSSLRHTQAAGSSQLTPSDPMLALDDRFKQLTRIFEIASWNTKVFFDAPDSGLFVIA